MKTRGISSFAAVLIFGLLPSLLEAGQSPLEPLKGNDLNPRQLDENETFVTDEEDIGGSQVAITPEGDLEGETLDNAEADTDKGEDSPTKPKEKNTRTIIDSLLQNTEHCTEELSKLLDFSSIVSSSCGVDALKKVGGWLSKHKNSLPYWPSVNLPPPKNLITFYGCDWTICEREVENQIDQKLKKLHLPAKHIGSPSQSDTRNYDAAWNAVKIQVKNGNMPRGELINSIGIWWCQKALPQLITDKETAYHSIFKEFNIQIDQDAGAEGGQLAEEGQEFSVDKTSNMSVIVTKDSDRTGRDTHKYPSRLVFLKTALEEPMECYVIEPEKDHETIKEELREIVDSERNRLESNLAFVLQIGTTIWRSNKTFSPMWKSTTSLKRLICTMRAYIDEIRRDLFKLFPPTDSEAMPLPPHEDLVILISEICRIQSITDAISLVVIRLLRRNKFSKKVSEDAEHLLMNWMFADMNVKKSLVPVTKPTVTKKSSPSFIERAKRMKINAHRVIRFMNAIADKD